MQRRKFIGSVAGGSTGFLLMPTLHFAGRQNKQSDSLNILLITADDLGPQLGCYGDETVPTPHLDKLASEGVRFDNAYVTQASCSPSRSSIFTGLYPHQNGQLGLSHRGYSMHSVFPTIQSELKAAGYYTGVIGKIHVEPKTNLSFDYKPSTIRRDMKDVANKVGTFFNNVNKRPFFLMVNYFDPHKSYDQVQVNGLPENPVSQNDVGPFSFIRINNEAIRNETAGYYNCVQRLDAGIGLLMEKLTTYNFQNNTLVIFLGDHGPPFTRAKTTCYEAGLKVPFIVWKPGLAQAGLVLDEFISTVDIFPTLMEAAGLNTPEGLAGCSFYGLIQNQNIPWRDLLFGEFNSHVHTHFFPRRSVRNSQYKLIHNLLYTRENPVNGADGCPAWAASRENWLKNSSVRKAYDTYKYPPEFELYNLEKDGDEIYNLADQSEYATVLQDLKTQLLSWRECTEDPYLDLNKLAEDELTHYGSITVNIDDQEPAVESHPADFVLEQNYPNPFNGRTVISCRLSVISQVQLNVYNLRGQKVKNLYSGFWDAGLHEVVWDGRDHAGRPVSSGVYICRLRVGNRVEKMRMVLSK